MPRCLVPINSMRTFSIATRALSFVLLCILCSCTKGRSSSNASEQLHQLLAEQWQYELKTNPDTATYLGDKRYNSQLPDYSPQGLQKDASVTRDYLRKFEAIDARELSQKDELNQKLMIRRLHDAVESFDLKMWEMSLDQMNGFHLTVAQLPGYTSFTDTRDYNDYVSRLKKIPIAFEQIEEDVRLGVRDHLVPPRYLLEKIVVQAEQIAKTAPEKSPFAAPVMHFPQTISAGDQERIRTAVLETVKAEVLPAYKKFGEFVRVDYAPSGRTDPGIWALPNGDALYRRAVRLMTTTNLTPEQYHEIGLKQVKEIEAQMLALASSQGYPDLKRFNAYIKENKRFYAKSSDQIVDLFRSYIGQMRAEMPNLFSRLPKAQLEVRPMESFRAKDGAPADYTAGSQDGKRPGRINVNTWDPTNRLTLNIESTAYHEGIPGHHQQIALAQETTDLPDFRRHGGYSAFIEGWALYAERLGKEAGFYKDPFSEYGRLENEMWRAVRLVVDTGVHYKHWTREQMIDFFHAHTALDEPSVQAEVDRYIAWPGQALAYKAGQLNILEMREKARRELGANFDLRAFDDAVLANGSLPLDVLDDQINAWIAQAKH
jgi:uncharacterized protein (DUF885 family)